MPITITDSGDGVLEEVVEEGIIMQNVDNQVQNITIYFHGMFAPTI